MDKGVVASEGVDKGSWRGEVQGIVGAGGY